MEGANMFRREPQTTGTFPGDVPWRLYLSENGRWELKVYDADEGVTWRLFPLFTVGLRVFPTGAADNEEAALQAADDFTRTHY